MKLSSWAKKQGISYRCAWSMFRRNEIPGAYALATGTIIVPDPTPITIKEDCCVVYARVSSSENKENLDRQAERLVAFCNANGWSVSEVLKEVGSGLNDKRKKLLSVLGNGKATRLVVEHKDRLARFGVEYIRLLCEKVGCQLVIVNKVEGEKEDIVQDFVSIITSFCAKIYGQRRSKRKTEKLIRELEDAED